MRKFINNQKVWEMISEIMYNITTHWVMLKGIKKNIVNKSSWVISYSCGL